MTILLRLKLIIYFIVWKMTVVITGKSFGSYWETNTLGLSPISIWLSMYCSVVRMMKFQRKSLYYFYLADGHMACYILNKLAKKPGAESL